MLPYLTNHNLHYLPSKDILIIASIFCVSFLKFFSFFLRGVTNTLVLI